jgi:hypothetical protein
MLRLSFFVFICSMLSAVCYLQYAVCSPGVVTDAFPVAILTVIVSPRDTHFNQARDCLYFGICPHEHTLLRLSK